MGKIADVARAWGVGQEQLRQMLAFDRELEETKTERDNLKAQKLALEAKIEPMQEQVDRLNGQLEEQTAKTARAEKLAAFKASKPDQVANADKNHLNEQEEEVLRFLAYARLEHGEGAPLNAIAKMLKVNEIRAQVIVRGMSERRYIWYDQRVGEGWKLNDKGEKYLVDKGIL